MSIKERKFLYEKADVDGNTELDYLSYKFTEMNLKTSTIFRIPKVFKHRPDLISYRFYGNYHMGWLIAHHNDFLDPIMDFVDGIVINIPDMDAYFRYFKANSRRS